MDGVINMYQSITEGLTYFDLKYKYSPGKTGNWLNYWSMPEGYSCSVVPEQPETKSYLGVDPLETIMGERKALLGSKIEMILSGIEERKKIKQKNLYRIDKDYCSVLNVQFQMPREKQYSVDRDRLTLERMKKDLEQQKRMEEVNYFRDLGLLKKDLTETMIEYLSEQNKQNLISNLEE